MASGHRAGLVSAKTFMEDDQRIRKRQAEEEKRTGQDKQNTETVYRGAGGKKKENAAADFLRKEYEDKLKKEKEEAERYEWGMGTVQKKKDQAFEKQLEDIHLEPVVPQKDDPRRDAELKAVIHSDDPMAAHFLKKQASEAAKARGGKPAKPVYKGPQPPPNRFGLPPGYRWDGRDRGTGWEHRVITSAANKKANKDAAYEWSVSDM